MDDATVELPFVDIPPIVLFEMAMVGLGLVLLLSDAMPNTVPPLAVVTEMMPVATPLPTVFAVEVPIFAEPLPTYMPDQAPEPEFCALVETQVKFAIVLP